MIRSAGGAGGGQHRMARGRRALARAEWLKLYGGLPERGAQGADALWCDEGALSVVEPESDWRCPDAERPLVMTGRSTRGQFVDRGRPILRRPRSIRDAGGRYAWADDTSAASTSVDLEAQVRRAANADVWINGGGWKSLAAMLDDEPRYAAFKAYRQGQVWIIRTPRRRRRAATTTGRAA